MRLIFVFLICFLTNLVICAQTVTLKGTVTDEIGSVIPATRVHLLSSDGRSFWAITNADGDYELKVEPGKYHLSFAVPPFIPIEVKDYLLTSQSNRLDIVLKACAECPRIDDLVAEPEPIETRTKNEIIDKVSSRPLYGMSRFCGTALNAQGASIPNVSVSFQPEKRSKSGKRYDLKTDGNGKFDFGVIDGLYKITFKKESYKKFTLRNQLLPSNANGCKDITLKSSVRPHQIT
jgi:hypothetical protein